MAAGVPIGDIGRTHKALLDVSWVAAVSLLPHEGAVLGVDAMPSGSEFSYRGLLVPGGPGCYVYFHALT